MIYKISPDPSLPKRGRKEEFSQSRREKKAFPKEGK